MSTSMATLCVKRLAMLLTAPAVLQDENRWIQGNFAGCNREDQRNYSMASTFSPDATCFCAMGGMAYATTLLAGHSPFGGPFVPDFLDKVYGQGLEIYMQGAVNGITNRPVSLASLNDNSPHERVLRVFAWAIADATKNLVMRHTKLGLDQHLALAKQELEAEAYTWGSRARR